jgi:glycosyltransferase involved in cell wall biosynthesis
VSRDFVIDVTRLVGRTLRGRFPTGVDRVDLAYISHYGPRSYALIRYMGFWLVLSAAESRAVFEILLSPSQKGRSRLRCAVAKALATLWASPRKNIRFLLNIAHSGLDKPDYAERLKREGWQSVFFLHDLIPITHPEYCRDGEARKHEVRLQTMLTSGRGIIVNSNATRQALESYASRKSMALPDLLVAPLAPASLPLPDSVPPLDHPYFVVLGTIEPRKNHLTLLQVWRRLAETLGNKAPRLIIVGQRGWECEQVIDLLERSEALKDLVLELPHCSDSELSTYLHHARALLFPSFEEGYGLPLVEALMAGIPVIASDIPIFHEIAGNIPDKVDPLDGLGWLSMIEKYSKENSPERNAQLAKISHFTTESWETHLQKADVFLKEIGALQ